MADIYIVRTVPVRDTSGSIVGWVRADVLADGSRPTDLVFLRDGTGCGQAAAMTRIARDPRLLYASREEAVRDGLSRLRLAAASDGERPMDHRGRRRAQR